MTYILKSSIFFKVKNLLIHKKFEITVRLTQVKKKIKLRIVILMTKNSEKDKILACIDIKIFYSCDMIFYSAYEGTQKNV